MKRKMTVAILVVMALVAIVLAIGLWLPQQRAFVKTAELKSPPDKVFRMVTDFENQTEWRNDVQEIKVIDSKTWTEVPKKGTPITFRTKQKIENQVFEIEVIEPENFKGYWVGTFEKTQNGTKITFREVIIIENPFFRVLSYLFVNLDGTMGLYVNNLKTKLGE